MWIVLTQAVFPVSILAAEQPRQTVLLDNKPAFVYQAVPNPKKPYVLELFSPSGVNLLRDSPIDHKHHHGLMFAVAVDGVNFWAEDAASGSQIPTAPPTTQTVSVADVTWQVLCQKLQWRTPQNHVLLEEDRSIGVARIGDPQATLLTWRSVLRTPEGKTNAHLSGSSYFGLGMRFVPSMDTGGQFFNADGRTGVEGTNEARSAWCAYTAKANGKTVTVAVFDGPRNARHPATWFTMDRGFAYLSATLNLNKEPFTIQTERPLELRYGVAVWDGQVDQSVVEKLYRQWTQMTWPQPPSNSPPPQTPQQ